MSPWPHSAAKRVCDIAGSLSLLCLLWPLMLGIAAWLRCKEGAPILFKQTRPGKNGIPFTLIKFRTLRGSEADTDRPEGKIPPSAFTAFLRCSGLDELPELVNILKGDMSFVGPRPLLTRYLDRYTPEQARRHEVRPGLTGWAQMKGRNALDWETRLVLDVHYVDNATVWMDLHILGGTLLTILRREGAHEPGEFMGSSS